MTKPNVNSTLTEMKSYIRKNKLNHPDVKLGMKKSDMIAGLKRAGHWDSSIEKMKKSKPKKAPKKTPPKPKVETPKPKKETPKPPTPIKPAKPNMLAVLQNLDIDVSGMIGEKVKLTKMINNLTRGQLAKVYRKLYEKKNPGKTIKISKGVSEEKLIKLIKDMEPSEEDIPKKKAKGDKKNKVIILGWGIAPDEEDEPDFLKSEGWTFENAYPSGLQEYSKMLTQKEGFKEKSELVDMMGGGFKMYYETAKKQMIYHDGL